MGRATRSRIIPTSYIPTEASQVTRAADVASVNTLSPWYRADEWTLVVKAVRYQLSNSAIYELAMDGIIEYGTAQIQPEQMSKL